MAISPKRIKQVARMVFSRGVIEGALNAPFSREIAVMVPRHLHCIHRESLDRELSSPAPFVSMRGRAIQLRSGTPKLQRTMFREVREVFVGREQRQLVTHAELPQQRIDGADL